MPRLSIVIACFEQTSLLEETLVAVLQHRPDSCEIVVVHDGRYEDPYDLTDEVQFVEVARGTGWTAAFEAGIRVSSGDVIHLLGSGVIPEAGWTDSVMTAFANPAVGSVIPVVLDGDGERIKCVGVGLGPLLGRQLVGSGKELDAHRIQKYRPLAANLAASFFRYEALEELGGLVSEFGDDWADLDLGRRLDAAGYETSLAPQSQLRCAAIDQPRPIRFSDRGRQHQRLIQAWPELSGLRRSLASWGQIVLETLTSVRDPRRLASVWGRWSERRSQRSLSSEPATPVLSLEDHRAEGLSSSSEAPSHRRAA